MVSSCCLSTSCIEIAFYIDLSNEQLLLVLTQSRPDSSPSIHNFASIKAMTMDDLDNR